jgi:hypothetical protein
VADGGLPRFVPRSGQLRLTVASFVVAAIAGVCVVAGSGVAAAVPGGAITLYKSNGLIGHYAEKVSGTGWGVNGDTSVSVDECSTTYYSVSTCDAANEVTNIQLGSGNNSGKFTNAPITLATGAIDANDETCGLATSGGCYIVVVGNTGDFTASGVGFTLPTATIKKSSWLVGNYLETVKVKYFPVGDTVNAVECDSAVDPATNLSTNCDLATSISGTVGATGTVVLPTKLKVLVGDAYSDIAAGACAPGSTCAVVVYDGDNQAIAENFTISTATPTVTITPNVVVNANGKTAGVTVKYFPIGDTVNAIECDNTMVPLNAASHCDSATQLNGVANSVGAVTGSFWHPTTRIKVLTTVTSTPYSDTAGGSCAPGDTVVVGTFHQVPDPCFVYVSDTANSSFSFTPALSIEP